ncbi:MAG: motility protein A [Desulfovibrio sp.]|jgi:chemotaxis protein MotA|nr:motility protein A [Desulfovibrio sp.]
MDQTTIIGALVSFGMIAAAIAVGGGDFMLFIDLPSFLLVLGGTVGAVLTQYPFGTVRTISALAGKMIRDGGLSANRIIDNFMEYAQKARRDGILALEENVREIEDPYLRKGLNLAVDGLEPEVIQNIMETEIANTEARHETGIEMADALASYAPAIGMLGTVIGLVKMLKNMDEPSAIGPGLALALITTFYGSLLANFVFLPMVGKLRHKSKEEIKLMEMQMEGVLAISRGENPRIIMEKLSCFQSPKERGDSR